MSSYQQHCQGPNTGNNLRRTGGPERQLGRIVLVPAIVQLASLVTVADPRLAQPPRRKRQVPRNAHGRHDHQYGGDVSSHPRAAPLPLVGREPDGGVDQADVEDQPDDEARRLEQGLADVEAEDHLPGDVEREAQQRHAVGLGLQAATRHEDVRRVPAEDADAQGGGRQGHQPAGGVVGGDVGGAHLLVLASEVSSERV